MRLTQLLTNDGTLLNYAMVTNPDPLGVGSTAIITFAVSAPEGPSVNVQQITFALPVGDATAPDPTDLTDTPPTPSCASISSSGTDVWTIAAGADAGVFIASPPNGTPIEVGPQGLTIMFAGIVISPLVGTATIYISEWASATGTPPTPGQDPSGTTSIAVPKFPAGFYAGNFVAVPPEVQNGQPATLTWIGTTNGDYKIYSGIAAPVDVSSVRSWSTGNLTDVTSFVLEASAQEGGQTVFLYFTATVTVADPSIVANDLTVLTTSALNGAVNVGTANAAAGLTVTGDINGSGAVNAAGTVTAGAFSTSGAATVGSLSTSGQVSANSVQTSSLNASSATLGSTSVNGLNSSQGAVVALGGMQSISPGSWGSPNGFTSSTDGFVIGTCAGPTDYPSGGCILWYFIQSQGVTIQGTGGNVGFFGPSWDDCMANNPQSIMMPIAANNTFWLAVQQDGGDCNQTNASYGFWFMPVGAGAAGAMLAKSEDGAHIPVDPPVTGDKMRRHWDAPDQFVAILETVVDKPIDPATQQQLIDVLHRM